MLWVSLLEFLLWVEIPNPLLSPSPQEETKLRPGIRKSRTKFIRSRHSGSNKVGSTSSRTMPSVSYDIEIEYKQKTKAIAIYTWPQIIVVWRYHAKTVISVYAWTKKYYKSFDNLVTKEMSFWCKSQFL